MDFLEQAASTCRPLGTPLTPTQTVQEETMPRARVSWAEKHTLILLGCPRNGSQAGEPPSCFKSTTSHVITRVRMRDADRGSVVSPGRMLFSC